MQAVNSVVEDSIGSTMPSQKDIVMDPIYETVDQELVSLIIIYVENCRTKAWEEVLHSVQCKQLLLSLIPEWNKLM